MLRKLAYSAIALIALVLVARGAGLPLPAVNGPYLGDQNNNLYAITQAHLSGSGYGSGSAITTISQTSGQSNCTQTGLTNMMHYLKTSAGTGYICLPTAYSGRLVLYLNATGQTIDVYSDATSYTSGTADTINGTAGTTPYTGLTIGKNLLCFAPANGVWACGAIS
jgi:hypothetical protein